MTLSDGKEGTEVFKKKTEGREKYNYLNNTVFMKDLKS